MTVFEFMIQTMLEYLKDYNIDHSNKPFGLSMFNDAIDQPKLKSQISKIFVSI